MVTYAFIVTFATLILLMRLQIGTSLNCYVCVTAHRNEKCYDPFDRKNHTADTCDNPKDICLKEKLHPIGALPINLRRGCATADYCKTIGAKSIHCSTCDTNLCNKSFIKMPSFNLLSSTVLFGTILKSVVA